MVWEESGVAAVLPLSFSDFDQDLANIVAAVGKNPSIKRLSIGRNFANMKTK